MKEVANLVLTRVGMEFVLFPARLDPDGDWAVVAMPFSGSLDDSDSVMEQVTKAFEAPLKSASDDFEGQVEAITRSTGAKKSVAVRAAMEAPCVITLYEDCTVRVSSNASIDGIYFGETVSGLDNRASLVDSIIRAASYGGR